MVRHLHDDKDLRRISFVVVPEKLPRVASGCTTIDPESPLLDPSQSKILPGKSRCVIAHYGILESGARRGCVLVQCPLPEHLSAPDVPAKRLCLVLHAPIP